VKESPAAIRLSVVIPVRDENGSVDWVSRRFDEVLTKSPSVSGFEIIFVDDGSQDGTSRTLETLAGKNIRCVRLPAVGKTAALKAGFDAARYDVIATADGDGQDQPEDLVSMIQLIVDGNDFIVGWRRKRRDSFRKKLSSRIANAVRRLILWDPFHDIGCGLRMFRKECLADFPGWEGAHRFLPYFAWRRGRRVAQIKVSHRPRLAGRSKYGILDRLAKTTVDLLRVRFGGR
jgi:dolichol-phosphate mannosyltransferase